MRPIRWFALALAPLLGLAALAAPAGAQHGPPHQGAPPAGAAASKRTPAPPQAFVYIGRPVNGEVFRAGQIKIWFGARNIGVAPAGVAVANTGHHHLLINTPVPPLDEPIPNSKNHLHFGAGQTEASIDLTPGTYTLQLIMGDAEHVPHDPPVVSRKITIHVR